MLNNKTVLKICSAIIAVCLWGYVIGEVDPEGKAKVNQIEIDYINSDMLIEKDLAVDEDEPVYISVTITGKRSDLGDAKEGGITAWVDVSECKVGSNSLPVNVDLPDGLKLAGVSDEKIDVEIGRRVSEERPVKVGFSDEGKLDGSIPKVLDCSPEKAYVSGVESQVKKVAYIEGIVNIKRVDKKMRNLEAELTPVDEEGEKVEGIQLSYNVAYADVQLLSVKKVALKTTAENVPDGMKVKSIDTVDEIIIAGIDSSLENMDVIEGIADLSEMTDSGKVSLKLDLPEGVYLNEEDSSVIAEITLESRK